MSASAHAACRVSRLSPVPTGRMNAEVIGRCSGRLLRCSPSASSCQESKAGLLLLYLHHVMCCSRPWVDRRSSGRLPLRPTTIAHRRARGDGESRATVPSGFLWHHRSHFWQRHQHAHLVSSDFRQTNMSFASVLCGLTSVGQHTTLG